MDAETAVAAAFSVIRDASVPLGITTPDRPNISSTRWRCVSDHGNRRYRLESTRSSGVLRPDLAGLDFGEGALVRKLMLTDGSVQAGSARDPLAPAEPFTFL